MCSATVFIPRFARWYLFHTVLAARVVSLLRRATQTPNATRQRQNACLSQSKKRPNLPYPMQNADECSTPCPGKSQPVLPHAMLPTYPSSSHHLRNHTLADAHRRPARACAHAGSGTPPRSPRASRCRHSGTWCPRRPPARSSRRPRCTCRTGCRRASTLCRRSCWSRSRRSWRRSWGPRRSCRWALRLMGLRRRRRWRRSSGRRRMVLLRRALRMLALLRLGRRRQLLTW